MLIGLLYLGEHALRTANAPLREVIQAKDELLAARDAQVTVLAAQAGALAARVAELERRPGKDSPDSSRPPSPDSPHANKPRDRADRRAHVITGCGDPQSGDQG